MSGLFLKLAHTSLATRYESIPMARITRLKKAALSNYYFLNDDQIVIWQFTSQLLNSFKVTLWAFRANPIGNN
jgi:hypothetical protein